MNRNLSRSGWTCQHWRLGRGKRAVRVKGDYPYQIYTYRGEYERYLRQIEDGEEEKSIWQEAAPDDELRMTAYEQQQV